MKKLLYLGGFITLISTPSDKLLSLPVISQFNEAYSQMFYQLMDVLKVTFQI